MALSILEELCIEKKNIANPCGFFFLSISQVEKARICSGEKENGTEVGWVAGKRRNIVRSTEKVGFELW